MNYPVWEIYYTGGGLLMVVIAVVHVYVAHFAVGGGLFLVLTELKALRDNSHDILIFTKSHSKFFMLLTMVFGSITGVGIWFTISLLSPGPTSTLIHTFVFGFAIEWICFVGEIFALFIYYYRFDKMERSSHLIIGWLYFIFAWLSLFVINGIIDVMLTPGKWLETNSFWDGFFNPSMLPALVFRTALSFFLAGIFGFITAALIRKNAVRTVMVQYCSKWLAIPLPFMILAALWYFSILPEPVKQMVLGASPEILPALKLFGYLLIAFVFTGLLMWVRMSRRFQLLLACISIVVGLVFMGSFEWIREAGRRPYLIYGHTYSNSIKVSDEKIINQKGLLKTAKWAHHRDINTENLLYAGREIFRLQCTICHSVGGPMNDILPLTKKFTLFGMEAQLNGQGKIRAYMPRFMGTVQERKALAAYIVKGLHKKPDPAASPEPIQLPVEIPEFDDSDSHVLLAWSSHGMAAVSDCDLFWSIQPPGRDIYAQLIQRGEIPEIVSENVEITYRVSKSHQNPSGHVAFWRMSENLVGKKLPLNKGLSGNGLSGSMVYDEKRMVFMASQVPILPYTRARTFIPYPAVSIEAKSRDTGALLAKTSVVVTVSTEMSCNKCHGGGWRMAQKAGIADETARNILIAHDNTSRTNLFDSAQNGKPINCRSCHAGSQGDTPGDPDRLNLSAAIHGFHANYLTGMGDDACHACHPSASDSQTQAFRGIHKSIELSCSNCHLPMTDHALSLLVAEQAASKKSSEKLLRHLRPVSVNQMEAVKPRKPWMNEPDCLSCHIDFEPPDTDEVTFGSWTRRIDQRFLLRTDDAGISCMACHGSSHAIYPSHNRFGRNLDNIQPVQYQQTPYPIGANRQCRVCHTVEMEDEIHHPNMLGSFRNIVP